MESFERAAGSGWTKLDDGSLVNDREVEEQFFQRYPEFKRFRRTTRWSDTTEADPKAATSARSIDFERRAREV
jgi:hypothetical protein